MYFQIDNTPEHIRKGRRTETIQKKNEEEECPRLILAAFSRPPQVVFENVSIGTSSVRTLEVYNPSKQVQQITLGKSLPEGLIIHLPEEWLLVEPETCYCITLQWNPIQPTALRDTIRFTNENRGRYDVIVVLKTGMATKGKGHQSKGFKISPGKIKKKPTKKSPVSIYKKKTEVIYNTTKLKTVNVVKPTQHRILQSSNRDNFLNINENSMTSQIDKCPFDSPTSLDLNFDTSEIFSNMRHLKSEKMQQTYDKSSINIPETENNVKPNYKKQLHNLSAANLFDNLAFSPLRSIPTKKEKLEKGPKIILSMNLESDFDDSLNNKENETHSIISITSTQPPNKWMTVNQHQHQQIEREFIETPTIPSKKIPNTSSPKELNSPNFSINTEFSRISDLSFFPQRFSTERKGVPKINNETQDLIDDINVKLSSDTYTKDSPNTPVNFQMYSVEPKPPNYFMKEQQPKMCRQALFKESQHQRELREKNYMNIEAWQHEIKQDIRSPPRSVSPTPLQSIPEESNQFADTQILDKTDKQTTTFTINRTFGTEPGRPSMLGRQSWSKKSFRAEPELWKMPVAIPKKSLKPKVRLNPKGSSGVKISNTTFDQNTSYNTSIISHYGNVYSQSSTVDPFLSSTYFYDEAAVDKFENEFKRWLNCILTPPADLDSNIEQKIDVGKAWIENRNKEVPLAPTKEQVCSAYHNSHRLDSLRRSARSLLVSAEIAQVFQKLNAQIEKKLIAIRTDRNLHLDVGLQKIIMELLLSYNPLWLRIGLEAIYGIILPLKSNSDVEGLTTFIIQRMFKNPHLKNKHSKSSVPNMLLPAYMEAIKKFTLKKFFMLVFFLDQAKQRKLISHDPCLFCRNAVCKESREVIIRFTRELIAGIGDITKHLRPLGYVVCHKQSYLDEYKYAVHNIAVDLRDGVRLTKVMEIILMKNGLLHQLRTPAISRLQKIHNVQVALSSLKEACFVIEGDISANDIADGHREKTLSLLWQLIHVFRAPLFEKAATVIQMWWKKKYDIIIEKRREDEKLRQKLNDSASVIQRWWRRIQYNRLVEWQMQQVTRATLIIQKYFRMWFYKSQFRKMKISVMKIENWYTSIKMIREAKKELEVLKVEKEKLRQRSAIIIQSFVRRWLCLKQYKSQLTKIVLVQSLVRRFIIRNNYVRLKSNVVLVQNKYRSKLLMKAEMKSFVDMKNNAIKIQSYYRMIRECKYYRELKHYVVVVQKRFKAKIQMRIDRTNYLNLKKSAIVIQSLYRCRKQRMNYVKQRDVIIQLQRTIRAKQLMKKEMTTYLRIKKATQTIQLRFKSYLVMKNTRSAFLAKRDSAVIIQKYFRSYLLAKTQRKRYLELRNASLIIQKYYRSLLLMREQRLIYRQKIDAILYIQRQYRARILMLRTRKDYEMLRFAAIILQTRYRALIQMRKDRNIYLRQKNMCMNIQQRYRAKLVAKQQRNWYIQLKLATINIQKWFRNSRKGKQVKQDYQQTKKATVIIQRTFRAYIIGRKQRQEYLRIRTATVCIQNYYRSYIEMKTVREQYIQFKMAAVTIQRFYKGHLDMKKRRTSFETTKKAALFIQSYYRRYRESKIIRQKYCTLKKVTVFIQHKYRSKCAMKRDRLRFIQIKHAAETLQKRYRALLSMRKERESYKKLHTSVLVIQRRYRSLLLMRQERLKYVLTLNACIAIQRFYRAYSTGKAQREAFLKLKNATLSLQQRFRALLIMRENRQSYLNLLRAALILQNRYRARRLMIKARHEFKTISKACVTIQVRYRSYLMTKKQKAIYTDLKCAAVTIQRHYRHFREAREVRNQFLRLRNTVINIQRIFRAKRVAENIRRNKAASKIQVWFKSVQVRNICRHNYLQLRLNVIKLQSIYRMKIQRQKFIHLKQATITLQRFYRAFNLKTRVRQEYIDARKNIIKIQAHVRTYLLRKRYLTLKKAVLVIQAAYRFKKQNDRSNAAAICIQKNVRKYLAQSYYTSYRNKVIFLQKLWKGKLVTRLMRCEFLQKRSFIVRLQSMIRGYLVRKQVELRKEDILRIKNEKRQYWAASRIQALFRGHKARVNIAGDSRVTELRRRWREGALKSTQESLKERNEEAMEVLRNMSDIETVIRAFRSLELLTEVFPMMYHENASSIVRRVYIYMSVTNRSISSIEVLKSAASVLVNLTRYRITGPKIYARDRIPPILKFMWRFSNSETHLFCILSTYIWLFSKYDGVREDLTEFLHMSENHKMLTTIKGNVDRMKRMASNVMRSKFHTPQLSKFVSHTSNQSLNASICSSNYNINILLPAVEPDYGIVRADKPRYFEDAQQAITCLFITYNL